MLPFLLSPRLTPARVPALALPSPHTQLSTNPTAVSLHDPPVPHPHRSYLTPGPLQLPANLFRFRPTTPAQKPSVSSFLEGSNPNSLLWHIFHFTVWPYLVDLVNSLAGSHPQHHPAPPNKSGSVLPLRLCVHFPGYLRYLDSLCLSKPAHP